MAFTLPTFASNYSTWTGGLADAVTKIAMAEVELDTIANPSLRFDWMNKKYIPVYALEDGTGYGFKVMYRYGGQDLKYASPGNITFTPSPKQTHFAGVSKPVVTYADEGITDFDKTVYGNEDNLINAMSEKAYNVNYGMTYGLNHEYWSATGTEGVAVGGNLDIDTQININQTDIAIKNLPGPTGRMVSLPMVIRPHVAGHTFQSISSSNVLWRPYVLDGAGNEFDSTYTAWVESTAGYVDLVTTAKIVAGIAATTITTSTVTLGVLSKLLSLIQRGAYRTIAVVMPTDIYDSITMQLFGQSRGTQEAPLVDIGVKASVEYPSYNAVLYADPTMDALWPYSIFAYDVDSVFWACVSNVDESDTWGPKVYPWVQIPGSTSNVFAKVLWSNRICINRRGCGAIHGVTA